MTASPRRVLGATAMAVVLVSLTCGFTYTRTVRVESTPMGANVLIGGEYAGVTPLVQQLKFPKSTTVVEIRVEKNGYEAQKVTLTTPEAKRIRNSRTIWPIAFELPEIRRQVPIEVRANVEGMTVTVDGSVVGSAPLQHTLVFARPNGRAPWPELTLRVEREGFEYRLPGEDGQPAYVRKLTLDQSGLISADHFVPTRFVWTPIRVFDVRPGSVAVLTSNVLSEVRPNEVGKPPAQITSVPPENALVGSRISTVPDRADQVVFSLPKREARPGASSEAEEEIVGANIWMVTGTAQTQMSEGRQFDIDPFVTADGRWIYFSSDRLRTRNLWRMPANGRGGYTKITGDLSSIDTEPAVSPDSGRVAYTSRSVGALPSSPSYIWIANADGTLPTQMRAGRSPAWSPDGKRLAFVSPENKIWLMDADGGNPTQLTLGDSVECCPIWTPLGKHIVFASNKAQNDLRHHNFDIWIMGADSGNQTQLTVNGSFDSFPAISGDGRHLYFFSNRGAQRAGQEALQIFRLELPPE